MGVVFFIVAGEYVAIWVGLTSGLCIVLMFVVSVNGLEGHSLADVAGLFWTSSNAPHHHCD